jgi:flagellar basal body-associated protein FliL
MSEEKAGKKKKGINPLLLIIVVLLLAIVGLGAYYIFVKSKPAPATQTVIVVQKPIVEATWSADEFLVNLADTNVDKYLKTTIKLTYDSSDSKLSGELDSNKDAIRDAIISVLRAKKAADLTGAGLDVLKSEIIRKVNKILGSDRILKVYYYDFLIQ